MMNRLKFEGAGWSNADSSKSTNVGNCRIRTVFVNNENKVIFLELHQAPVYKKNKIIEYKTYLEDCFIIPLGCDYGKLYTRGMANIGEYNKENILSWINKNLHCNFTELQICNNGEYRSFGDNCYITQDEHRVYDRHYEIKQHFTNNIINKIIQDKQMLSLINCCSINTNWLKHQLNCIVGNYIESKHNRGRLLWTTCKFKQRNKLDGETWRDNIKKCNEFIDSVELLLFNYLQASGIYLYDLKQI